MSRMCFGANPDELNESCLQRWRERYAVHYKTLHGEAEDCPGFKIEKSKFQGIISCILFKYSIYDLLLLSPCCRFYTRIL